MTEVPDIFFINYKNDYVNFNNGLYLEAFSDISEELLLFSWYARLPCTPLSPRICSNICPLSRWCYLTISSSAGPFTFCLQSFPASGSFPMSQLFGSGGQGIGTSVSASVLPVNIQGWFPLGWTALISLQSKGLSRVFSNTTVQKHQLLIGLISLTNSAVTHNTYLF